MQVIKWGDAGQNARYTAEVMQEPRCGLVLGKQ